jgi:hypothetical protein
MIAGLIFGVSSLTLLQFFVSYSRSLIAESRGHRLSEQAREICGIKTSSPAGEQFGRLNQLIALCPEAGDDGFKVKAVAVYFCLLGFAKTFMSWAIPSANPWIEAERRGCAYVAAVVLDRRIAHNRMVMADMASH